MIVRPMILGASALLALAACGRTATPADNAATADTADVAAAGNTANAAAASATAPADGAQRFADMAAASDAFEIETSRLAQVRGQSAAVKRFATAMIEAHTASTAKLKAAAGTIVPTPTLDADQQTTIAQLQTATGAAFDRAYIEGQAAGHQRTLDALRVYAADGESPALRAFAEAQVPVVAAHLNTAKGLKL